MPTVSRTFTVTPPPATILGYLKDFAHAAEWDAGTESCTQNGSGPVEVGTTWHNVSKIAGVTAELGVRAGRGDRRQARAHRQERQLDLDRPRSRSPPSGSGSEVTYEADLQMHGVAKLATPAMALIFEKLANDTEKQMTEVLNRL